MLDCFACQLADGRLPLPGGRIHRTAHWLVEHCAGPLGVGTLIVKPERHVTAVAELTDDEADELGPLLRASSRVVTELVQPDQVYNCLWSHAGGVPVHLHYVIQPVTQETMAAFDAHGPRLQLAMFAAAALPDPEAVESFAARARPLFSEPRPSLPAAGGDGPSGAHGGA